MGFAKRTLRLGDLRPQLVGAPSLLFRVASAYRGQRLTPAFSEKLMLVVTSVLRCRYCNWVHSELAARFGVGLADIEALLAGDISVAPEEEQAALAYAIDYASNGNPQSADSLSCYPEAVIRDIRALVEFVVLTNKLGNTFDAFVARLHGQAAHESSIFVEASVAMLMAPMYSAVAIVTAKGRNPFTSLEG